MDTSRGKKDRFCLKWGTLAGYDDGLTSDKWEMSVKTSAPGAIAESRVFVPTVSSVKVKSSPDGRSGRVGLAASWRSRKAAALSSPLPNEGKGRVCRYIGNKSVLRTKESGQ